MLAELRRLTLLQESWDGAGGLPVSSLAELASTPWLIEGIEHGLAARIMPVGDGGLLAEWRHGNRLLQIEWSPTGAGDFDIAIDHELLIEDALPGDHQRLFSLFLSAFLDEARTSLTSR